MREGEARTSEAELVRRARAAMAGAYAPYSHFHVGAALLAEDGTVHAGANVENAAYPAGCCAERTALYHAVAHGARRFVAIAICGGREGVVTDYCPPCGICRQALREFCDPGTFRVILAKDDSTFRTMTLAELLPESFGPDALAKGGGR